MRVIAGGLWLAGLLGWALLGSFAYCIIVLLIGCIPAGIAGYRSWKEEQAAASWRATYPSYKY